MPQSKRALFKYERSYYDKRHMAYRCDHHCQQGVWREEGLIMKTCARPPAVSLIGKVSGCDLGGLFMISLKVVSSHQTEFLKHSQVYVIATFSNFAWLVKIL